MTPKAIKAVRAKHGLTQEALAQILGVSFTTVNRWEHGKGTPRGMTLRALAAIARARTIPNGASRTLEVRLRAGTG